MKKAWEIMMIYPIAENFCSWGDCKNRTSHWSSWMQVIEEIRRLMLRSAEDCQQGEAEQKEEAVAAVAAATTTRRMEQMNNSRG
jgi:hypothetical protein